ncbi:MAG: 3-hydroxyacyl-CoA dehydrogenase family protein [Planctomycetota bacterium]|nr:3-hydroxyacyl-CoA dehydrogenase family protein [Planctomycetota bacterium]
MQTVGVAGLGLLGRGIAACLLSADFHVIGYDRAEPTRAEARKHIAAAIDDLVRRGGLPAALRDEWSTRYVEATSVSELASCDFVIESIFEDLDAKQKLFNEIEAVVGPTVPIASNTSALPISTLQRGRKHPERFIGTHWAEPCHLTRFLEVIRGELTNDATADAAMRLAKQAGKDPSLVKKDVEGFIVNRIGYAMYREAFWVLENGVADVETIDRSFRNAICVFVNIAGPFRWMDLSGIPAYAAMMKRLFPQLSNATEVPAAMREIVESGAKGISNGRGFYQYTPEEAARWERMLIENVWRVRDLQRELEQMK